VVRKSETGPNAKDSGQRGGVKGQKPHAILPAPLIDDVGSNVGLREGGHPGDGGKPRRAKFTQKKRGKPHPSDAVVGVDVKPRWE
jgi:hypothetical protein